MNEFKSFFKTVGGNEGGHCNYPTRLDTYGCGCQHDCRYCYEKSLLNFRELWDAKNPAVADIEKIKKTIEKIKPGTIIRLGGMTDCFQPLEKQCRITYETIKALNDAGVGYLIVTKSDMVASDEYMAIMDKNLAHIQITVTCFDDNLFTRLSYEKAPLPSKRIAAIKKLEENGFDVALRLSPFIPEYVDMKMLNAVKCDKILIEFLRVNTWIKKWLRADYRKYTVQYGGYLHLPLMEKAKYLRQITGFKELSVCEDEDVAYNLWKRHFNHNKEDCCNLRKQEV